MRRCTVAGGDIWRLDAEEFASVRELFGDAPLPSELEVSWRGDSRRRALHARPHPRLLRAIAAQAAPEVSVRLRAWGTSAGQRRVEVLAVMSVVGGDACGVLRCRRVHRRGSSRVEDGGWVDVWIEPVSALAGCVVRVLDELAVPAEAGGRAAVTVDAGAGAAIEAALRAGSRDLVAEVAAGAPEPLLRLASRPLAGLHLSVQSPGVAVSLAVETWLADSSGWWRLEPDGLTGLRLAPVAPAVLGLEVTYALAGVLAR